MKFPWATALRPTVVALVSDMGFLARDRATYGAGCAALTRVDRLLALSRRSR